MYKYLMLITLSLYFTVHATHKPPILLPQNQAALGSNKLLKNVIILRMDVRSTKNPRNHKKNVRLFGKMAQQNCTVLRECRVALNRGLGGTHGVLPPA